MVKIFNLKLQCTRYRISTFSFSFLRYVDDSGCVIYSGDISDTMYSDHSSEMKFFKRQRPLLTCSMWIHHHSVGWRALFQTMMIRIWWVTAGEVLSFKGIWWFVLYLIKFVISTMFMLMILPAYLSRACSSVQKDLLIHLIHISRNWTEIKFSNECFIRITREP